MRLYIAGPMTGIPDFNWPAFHVAARALRAQGYEALSPTEIWIDLNRDIPVPYRARLREDLYRMLECDGVALLDGWQDSKGATLEAHVARTLGMDVRPLGDWLSVAS